MICNFPVLSGSFFPTAIRLIFFLRVEIIHQFLKNPQKQENTGNTAFLVFFDRDDKSGTVPFRDSPRHILVRNCDNDAPVSSEPSRKSRYRLMEKDVIFWRSEADSVMKLLPLFASRASFGKLPFAVTVQIS